jgi:hypothetical protein
MIKKEINKSEKLIVKGKVVGIDEDGIHVLDPKTEEEDVIDYNAFECFIGKTISMNVTVSKKRQVVEIVEEAELIPEENVEDCTVE